jgi:hypothetical protein
MILLPVRTAIALLVCMPARAIGQGVARLRQISIDW